MAGFATRTTTVHRNATRTNPAPGWPASARGKGAGGAAALPAGQLIGPTPVPTLDALEHPRTATQLARLRLTASTASRHTTVLRAAGPVGSLPRGNTVLHRRTPLGDALMDGAL
jgi:hypothetical protein